MPMSIATRASAVVIDAASAAGNLPDIVYSWQPNTAALIDKGSAYEADGNVWFDVSKDPDYGKLSNRRGVNDFSKFQTHPSPFWTAARDDTMHHLSRLTFSASGTLRVDTYGFSGDGTPATVIDTFEYNLGAGLGAAIAVFLFVLVIPILMLNIRRFRREA